jgi:uncharacterized protein (UPF0548 family)
VFRLGRLSGTALAGIAEAAADSALTYSPVGATISGSLPSGYRHDRREIALPDRPDAFALAVKGLRRWVAHTGAGLAVEPRDPPTEGATVAVGIGIGPLTAVAVCRVVAVVDEADRFGFAYGTLPGHPEQGEEAFLVERTEHGVVFRIVAFSRRAEVLARLGGPVTRAVQAATLGRYLETLRSYVESAPA